MKIIENYSLKRINTFGIDASARYFAEPSSITEFQEILADEKFKSIQKCILGGGSNILFTKDVDGLVIRNDIQGIELINEDDDFYYVKAGGGVVWDELVKYCVEHDYAGLENLSLIPGTVGAGPIQNIGAYGVELKDRFFELQALKISDNSLHTFRSIDCKFGYRESVFKNKLKGQFVIVSVTYQLLKNPDLNTRYGAIEKEMEAQGATGVSIAAISKAICAIRSSKLPNPDEIGNAGSFFKNPEIAMAVYKKVKEKYPEVVAFPASEGMMKLAAGWLIEQCGWKGKRFDDAGVHALQALVLVNYGNATGREIIELSEKIIASVKEKFGITLEREVNEL